MRKLTVSRPPCLLEQFVVCEHKRLIQCTFQFSTTEATAKKENKLDSFEHKEIMQWLSVISWHCIHPMYCPLVSNCISRARASCAYLLRCFLNYDLQLHMMSEAKAEIPSNCFSCCCSSSCYYKNVVDLKYTRSQCHKQFLEQHRYAMLT